MKIPFKTLVVILLSIFVASLFVLNHVYACLTVAFVIAYLLNPIVDVLQKRKVPRDLAVLLTLILFSALLVLGILSILPKILTQAHELWQRLPTVYYSVTSKLGPLSERFFKANIFSDIDSMVQNLGDAKTLVQPFGGIVQGVFAKTLKVISALLGLLIIPLLTFYLLRDFPHIYNRFLTLVPKRHHKLVTDIRARLSGVLGGFIRGQLVVSLILSTYYSVALTLLNADLSLVLGIMAGFFNIIPYLGIVTVLVLTLLIALLHGAATSVYLGIGVIFSVGMMAEGSILTPRIVGRKVGLGPLTLILALLVGSELSGLVGMLLAVPLAAIAKVFLNVFLDQYKASDAYRRS